MEEDKYGIFETDLKEAFGAEIMDDSFATEVWCALANVDWHNPGRNLLNVSYSFRAAGGLIEELRGSEDNMGYMTWYCSGPDSCVSDYIAMSMKKKGWIADTLPVVCDEPKCVKASGCGFPIEGGYRNTCFEHSKFNEEKE